ncbi:unnamed protein product [Closterium sp. NIES-53]
MSTRKERSSSNGSPGTTPTPPPASGLQTEEGTATRPRASSSETPANQAAAFDPSMMEKFFSFMSFYEQHQQGAPAQSNNSNNNNNVTPMSLDGSSYARGNQQQQPTFAPYEPQRGSISFMPQPQPAPGQERTLDALQVQSQFAHVLKLQTTKPFDGKDFFDYLGATPSMPRFHPTTTTKGARILLGSSEYPQCNNNNNDNKLTRPRGTTTTSIFLYFLFLKSSTQEFKLYHGKGGLYIGKAVLKNNVFVLDFVPDLGTADSDGIVTFTSWTHPPDLDPDFSPEGFWYSHTIPEAERTRALVTIQHSAAAETTSAAAETTSAAAETTSAAAETSSTVAGTTTVAATATPVLVDEAPPTPAQQLKPAQREVHRSANFTASFYSNSDTYRRSHGHRASEDIWHARMGHPSNTVLNNTIRAGVLDKDSLLLLDGRELQRARGTCLTCPEADLPHRPFTPHHNPSAPAYAPLEKVYSDILYNREPGQVIYNYTITFIDAATRYVWHLNLPSRDMVLEAFAAWLPWPAALDHAVMLHNLLSSSSLPNNASPHLLWTGKQGSTKMLQVFGCMVQYRPPAARAGRFSQRAQWGIHLGIEKNYNAWKIFDVHSKETVAARDVIFYERLTLQTYLANLQEDQDPTGGFRGDRAFASAADEADWDEQNVANASEEAGPLPFYSVDVPMDEDSPRESLNAETFYYFADNGYVTPATVNTNEAERVGPNFIPGPEAGAEAAYPEDATLPRYSQTGLQILGLVTAVHGNTLPKEPATVQQALGGKYREKWHEAMDRELKALEERNTWKVVPISVARNKTILTGKWVFRVKTKADGTIEKFKARWVVRGFDQEHGRDFTETFAPVSRHTSLRILLAIAAMKKRKLQQIDVANAFLYALVDAEIFVELPHGTNGEPNQYLGLNIREEEGVIYINAAKYADTIAKRFALTPTTISTLYRYATGNHKEGSSLLKSAGIRDYQRKLGCLLFAAVTCRPDLSYSASQLATYLKKPEAEHLAELDRALHYFVSTSTIGLTYYKNTTTPTKLIGYMAADYLTKKLGKQKFEYCMLLTGQSHVTSSDTPEAKGSVEEKQS